MTPIVRMLEPVPCGERVFFPIVRDLLFSFDQGVVATVSPVALLFSEAGRWMFVPLEEGICPDILEKLS
jgi:hypothetical protein